MTPQEFCTANNIGLDQLVNAMDLYPGDDAAAWYPQIMVQKCPY